MFATHKTIFIATVTIFGILCVVALFLFFISPQYFWYIDSALVGLGIASILLFFRKYMAQGFALDTHKDFFPLDAILIILGMIMFASYFFKSL